MSTRILFLSLLLATASSVSAQAYRWVDENGTTHYSDTPPPVAETPETLEERRVKERASGHNRQHRNRGQSRNDAGAGIDCNRSLKNIRSGLSEIMAMGQDYRRIGELSDAEYAEAKENFIRLDNLVSVPHCRRSKGSDRFFYACMEDSGDAISFGLCVMMTPPALIED